MRTDRASDYATGTPLNAFLRQEGEVLEEGQAFGIMIPLLDALAEAHARRKRRQCGIRRLGHLFLAVILYYTLVGEALPVVKNRAEHVVISQAVKRSPDISPATRIRWYPELRPQGPGLTKTWNSTVGRFRVWAEESPWTTFTCIRPKTIASSSSAERWMGNT